jgi:hypothetical protein
MPLATYASTIAVCYSSAAICDRCAIACFDGDDPWTMARCIGLVMDCAQLCRSAAVMMSRHSEFADTICEACAEVCTACASECTLHDVKHCRQCAEACARCARMCRAVARRAHMHAAIA